MPRRRQGASRQHSAERKDSKGNRSRLGRLFGRSKKKPLSKQGSPEKGRRSKFRTSVHSETNFSISDRTSSNRSSSLELTLTPTESSDKENNSEVGTMPETPGSLSDGFAKEVQGLEPLKDYSGFEQSPLRSEKCEGKTDPFKSNNRIKRQEDGILSIDDDTGQNSSHVFFNTKNNPFRCGSIHNTLDNVCRTSPDALSKTKESKNKENKVVLQKLMEKTSKHSSTKNLLSTRAALARPFGRTSLPAHLAKNWLVQVTPELSKERTWQYQILVQKEEYGLPPSTIPSTKLSASSLENDKNCDGPELTWSNSLPATQVTRTLKDFVWLEQALNAELGGSALIPNFALAIYSKNDWTTTDALKKDGFEKGEWDPLLLAHSYLQDLLDREENSKDNGLTVALKDGEDALNAVNETLLSDWLSDVLNLVRGKGELLMSDTSSTNHASTSGSFIFHSEAMEMFLYRTHESLPKPSRKQSEGSPFYTHERDSNAWMNMIQKPISNLATSPMDIMSKHLSCLSSIDLCDLGGNNNESELDSISNLSYSAKHSDKILSRRNEIHTNRSKQRLLIRSNVINAQQLVISYQRENTLRAMYRLRILLEKEIMLSAAWKRYAIALSNLFGFEKDVQFSKIANQPKAGTVDNSNSDRKVSKTTIDDNLRILARQKVDRAIPSLKVLSGMLNAYFTDFSSVDSSLRSYSDSVEEMGYQPCNVDPSLPAPWTFQLKDISPMGLLSPSSSHDSDSLHGSSSSSENLEKREKFASNEERLQASLLQLCNSIHIRVARMGWKFFKMEAGQANLLNSAAIKLQSKVQEELRSSIPSLSSADNSKENEDNIKEIDIVRRLLHLSSTRKYKFQPLQKSSSISTSHTGSENSGYSAYDSSSIDGESQHTGMDFDDSPSADFEKILMLVNDRAGRWDAELAMTVMEAAGIVDADVMVEETSRDLRAVRKLSVGLRENVNRCKEALIGIKDVALGKSFQVRIKMVSKVFKGFSWITIAFLQ